MSEFKVGDKVMHGGKEFTLVSGPYSNRYGTKWWVTADSSEDHGTLCEEDMAPHPTFKVGDRAIWCGETVSIAAGPFKDDDGDSWFVVNLDSHQDFAYLNSLSPVPEVAEDTETINGVTYVMGARYRDRQGDFWEFHREGSEVRGEWSSPGGIDGDSGCPLDAAVEHFGPLTRVED